MWAKGLWAPGGLVEPTSNGKSSLARPRPVGKPTLSGVYMNQHLSLFAFGKAAGGYPGSEPDSGNPTVRDRRGACGNVAGMGVGLRTTGKPVDWPPNPTLVCASHFYPDSFSPPRETRCGRRGRSGPGPRERVRPGEAKRTHRWYRQAKATKRGGKGDEKSESAEVYR